MKQSTSYSQDQLKNLCDLVCDDIERLLQVLEVEDYRLTEKMVFCKCPIHDGDNESALNLYYTGESYRGNWKCRTHGCEETFRSSIIGFVRGVLSRQKYNWSSDGDKTVSFKRAIAAQSASPEYNCSAVLACKAKAEAPTDSAIRPASK